MSGFWHDLVVEQVAIRPNAPALSDTTGASWSWSGLDKAARAMADTLTQQGVARGDRVLLLAENCCAAVAVLFGCSRIGAAVIPFNARQTSAEIDRVIAHATPAAVLFTTEVSSDAVAHADHIPDEKRQQEQRGRDRGPQVQPGLVSLRCRLGRVWQDE